VLKATITIFAAALLALTGGANARAETYPVRPIQLIIPFDPGSSTDVVARAMLPTLSAQMGQAVFIVNKPGASGTLGAAELARAKPDGYTLAILGMAGISILPHVRKLTFELDSFDFVCQVYSAPVVVMVAPESPFNDIKAFLAWGRQNPEKIFYGSPGIGTPDHLNMAGFLRLHGVKGTHVPFGGGGGVTRAIMSGDLTAVANTTVLLRAYNLKPLAVLMPERLPDLPAVAAAHEFGPPAEASIWAVFTAPKGLLPEVRQQLDAGCRATLADPAYRATAERAGFPPLANYRDGAAFRTFVEGESAKYARMITAEGLTIE
jgi:tripartite-type tricarboxylate transporter receptor subunit TctC